MAYFKGDCICRPINLPKYIALRQDWRNLTEPRLYVAIRLYGKKTQFGEFETIELQKNIYPLDWATQLSCIEEELPSSSKVYTRYYK